MSGFVFKGIKEVKSIFRSVKGERTIRGWCSEINNYWGFKAFSYANLQRVLSKNNDCLMPHHIHYLTPFTPYEEEALLAIAYQELTLEELGFNGSETDDTFNGSQT
jgi:hypothetical protein